MHEIAHIYLGHEGYFLDDLSNLEDVPDEIAADDRAAEWLIPRDTITNFINNHPRLSKENISRFANSENIHPGILIGRLQKMGKLPYEHHRKFLVKVKDYLPSSSIDPARGEY
jgi:HTH-type transcriptional regulator / antitoxin HigA